MGRDDDERIRARAYELWEAEGKPDGRQGDHWDRARRELQAEEAGVLPPGEAPAQAAPLAKTRKPRAPKLGPGTAKQPQE